MTKNKKMRRIISFILCATMILSLTGPVSPSTKIAKAFPAGTTIDEDTYLTENEIKDTVLLSVLRVIANYTKAKLADDSLPALTGEENLLSEEYAAYNESGFTFGELRAYTGPVNLTKYADKITIIEGLGYARGASSFDLGACTSITSIPDNEFGKCAMTKIVLPATVTSLGYGAFQQSTKLKQVIIAGKSYNDDVTLNNAAIADLAGISTIGDFAFAGCNELNNITLNESTSLTIGTSSFSNCTSLTSIILPMSNANNIGESAFSGCTSLSEVTFNNSLTYIPSNLFSNTAISKVYITGKEYTGTNYMPSGLAYIGKNAFQQAILAPLDFSTCTKLTYIDEYAFAQATVNTLVLPECLESINSFAFNATYIDSLYIPDSVTTLGESVFRNSAMESISISPNVTEIKQYSFEDCSALLQVELRNSEKKPNKLTTIGNYAFKGCSCLMSTKFLMNAPSLETIEEYAFAKCCFTSDNNKDIYGNQIYYGLSEIILPNSVTTLGKYVFSDNYALITANLGSGVTAIPEYAFYISNTSEKTSGLSSVVLSDKLESIGNYAFANNAYLRTIGYTDGTDVTSTDGTAIFGDCLASIGNYAFNKCSAKLQYKGSVSVNSVKYEVLPENIHETANEGDESFLIYTEGATKLQEVYINPSAFTVTDEEKESAETIYVVAKHIWITPETYDNITFPEKYKGPSYLFVSNKNGYNNLLRDVRNDMKIDENDYLSAPSSEDDIDLYVSYSDIIPTEDVTTVKLYPTLFTGLKEITLPDSLCDTDETNALGTSVFANNMSLTTVNMSKNIKVIPSDAFNGCASNVFNWTENTSIKYTYTGLETINNIDNVTDINSKAFYNCSALKLRQSTGGGKISNALVNIGESAFENCKNITSVVFHSAIKTIGNNAFMSCSETDTGGIYIYTDSTTGETEDHHYTEVIKPENAKGLGLTNVDFTYATRLESIGDSAFANNAIKVVNLPKAAYKTVPASLFAGCQFLETVTIPDNVTYISANAFNDCSMLSTLYIPATAGVSGDILKGYVPYAISGLQMIVDRSGSDYEQSLPLERDLVLPINCLSDENRNGNYTVSVFENNEDTTGTVIFEEGESITGDIYDDYLDVRIEYGTSSKSPDKVILVGGSKAKDDIIVKVQIGSAFKPFGEKRGAVINAQTFTYKVDVKPIPAESINVTSTTSGVDVIENEDAAGNKTETLYISKSHTGVNLSAAITPATTTDECTWTIVDPEIATVTLLTEGVTETSKATIIPVKTGNTKLTLTCGTVTKDIYIYVKVPVTKLEATTDSTIKVTSTSTATDKFTLPVGDTDKITLNKVYKTTLYTPEEWENYADTIIFTSDNPEIVSVDSVGNIEAKALGTAKVTVKALASNISVEYTITVVAKDDYNPTNGNAIAEITGAKDLYKDETAKLSAVLSPVKAKNKVKWEITGGDATITEEGLVTAGSTPGTVTVKATMLDANGAVTNKTRAITFNVLQSATAINLTNAVNANTKMYAGEILTLSKTTKATTRGYNLTPETSTDSVICESSDDTIVSVTDNNGKFSLKALAQGTATITLTATSGVKTSFEIEVIEGITVITLPESIDINVGESQKLVPEITPANSNDSITWSTSKDTIVTVSEDGTINAVAKGTARVTATTSRGYSATVKVNVKVPATAIKITDKLLASPKLFVGKSLSIYSTTAEDIEGFILTPSNTSDMVTCTSSDEAVIKATASGTTVTLESLSKGTATITITTTSGKTASFDMTAVLPAEKIKVPETLDIIKGQSQKITPVITPSDHNDTITFSSSNESVATVSEDGTVTAVDKGTATIKVSGTNKVYANTTVNVLVPATAVNLTKAVTDKPITINTGSSITLQSTTKDTTIGFNLTPDTSTDNVTVTSSAPSIASVSEGKNGKFTVKGEAKGVATITVTATSGVSTSFNVTIIHTITEITLPKTISIPKGTTKQLVPTVKPVDHNDTITWSSANEKIATVDANGIVTAKEKGTVKITATSSRGYSATISVKVTIPCTKLVTHTNTNQNTIYMYEGQTSDIQTKIMPIDSTDSITYSSLNTTVAMVTGSGSTATITAQKKGTSVVTVTAESGVSTSVTVKVVSKKAAKKVKITGGNYVDIKDSIYLTAKLTAKTSTDKITWSSSKTTVATVDAYGCVTGIKKGTADITVKTDSGKTATVTIYVGKKPLPPQKVTVSGKKKVTVGKTIKLKYKTRNKVAKKNVTWSSSNPSIATVTSKGKVKGLKKGTVKITVSLKTGQKATIKIKVLKKKK